MVVSCCAYNCTERFVKGGPITFHSFPKDECRRKLWVLKIRRANFVPTTSSRVCSKHFTKDCFDREKFGGVWLKSSATPTVFDFTEHQPKRAKRMPPKERAVKANVILPTLDEGEMPNDTLYKIYLHICLYPYLLIHLFYILVYLIQVYHEDISTGSKSVTPQSGICTIHTTLKTPGSKPKMYQSVNDFSEEDMTSPEKAKKALFMAKKAISEQRKKMENCRKTTEQLKKRVMSLKQMLQELKQHSLLSDSASNILEISLDLLLNLLNGQLKQEI